MFRTVKVYTTPTCGFCSLVKQLLGNLGVKYDEIDLTADPSKISELVEISGQLGVPVTVVGNQVIIGYDRGKIESALAA